MVAVEPLTALLVVVEAVEDLAEVAEVAEAIDPVLRTVGGVAVFGVEPITDLVRVVEAVGEVTFLPFTGAVDVEAARPGVEGTVDFLVRLGVVEVVEVTEALLATPGVTVPRVEGVLVAGVIPGVLEARIGLVGLVVVEPTLVRTVGLVNGTVDFVMGVLEAVEVTLLVGGGAAEAPARPAAAKEDILLFTLGAGLSDIFY